MVFMLKIRFLFALSSLVSFLYAGPHLSITQSLENILDQEIIIRAEELTPFQIIELKAETTDQKGEIWTSHALFQADAQGTIDVTTEKPLVGSSYEIIDGMGLFWSMQPVSSDPASSFKCKDDRLNTTLTMRQGDGKILAKETTSLFLKRPDVQRREIRENGIVATLFLPPSKKPLPVIITLSGSNGGLSENRAKLLASHGFAVLALGYFGVEGLPSNLQNISLEYFETAFAWLKEQPTIDASRIGLYGISRGAELALLLGSLFPDAMQAIVAVSPSSVVYGGLNEVPVDVWIYHGKPVLPFAPVPESDFTSGKGQDAAHPVSTRQSFLEGMLQKEAFEAAAIPVENIRCPILLISGGDDQMWPSDLYANQILDRLEKNHSLVSFQHLHYPAAGHGINIPHLPIPEPTYYHPIGKCWLSMGGNRAADAEASKDSWDKLVIFFHQTLHSENL